MHWAGDREGVTGKLLESVWQSSSGSASLALSRWLFRLCCLGCEFLAHKTVSFRTHYSG